MYLERLPLYLALVRGVLSAQPNAPTPVEAPLRALPWGQLNFLHTTDTHGWHGGHLQEAQYSADWGDYVSFAKHLSDRADADGSDLLLVDTGDRVEGNGLYDASNPKGKYTFDIIKEQTIDIITPGNHELYLRNTSINEYYKTVPAFSNGYIASNLDIYDPKTGKQEALAPRYRRITTKNQGIRILAMGFLFDFKGNANNTVVQRVEDTVNEAWFQDALRAKDIDLIVIAGHIPVGDDKEFQVLYKAIRNVKWDTPIMFFGGHFHIRDYHVFDNKAHGLASGRYMETIGFQSISGLGSGKEESNVAQTETVKSPTYKRRYIDNNLYSMHHHTGLNSTTFPTAHGRNISAQISAARTSLDLDKTYGCAPKDYWLNRAPYPSNSSILTWLEHSVLPDTAAKYSNASAQAPPALILTNTGAMRFDIFAGPFTIDTTFLVSPFTSGFRKLHNVPYRAASRVLSLLNNEGQIPLTELADSAPTSPSTDDAFVGRALRQLLPPSPPLNELSRNAPPIYEMDWTVQAGVQQFLIGEGDDATVQRRLVPGYTTTDDLGSDGDDTIHAPIRFYDVPNCIAASVGFEAVVADEASDAAEEENKHKQKPETVDLVYNEFVQNWVLLALKYLGEEYTLADTELAFEGKTFTEVISDWVHENWACGGDRESVDMEDF